MGMPFNVVTRQQQTQQTSVPQYETEVYYPYQMMLHLY